MGHIIEVQAADGHTLAAYCAVPQGTPRGGLVVAPELFSITDHIREVADAYAADGYLAIAPWFYDRYERGTSFAYTPEGLDAARLLLARLDFDKVMLDIDAVARYAGKAGKVGVVGYCSGGTAAWLAAAKVEGLACAIGYYGSKIPSLAEEQPHCPVMLHWGAQDHTIALEAVHGFERAHPEVASCLWPTGHGFNCDRRVHHYHAESAVLARAASLAFLRLHVG
jgi:carboxymethylenebutenolidase